jgi:hypothetical protein
VTDVQGGITSHDFRFELLNEKIRKGKNWIYISDGMIILSPIGAKRLLKKLQDSVLTYEKENGIIPLNPKDDKIINVD